MSSLTELLADFSGNAGADDSEIASSERSLGFMLPSDYKKFLTSTNGGEGFFGKHYLILWKVEELAQFNREYEVQQYAPGLVLIGSTGGGEGFAFDTRTSPHKIVQVPFIGMDLDSAMIVADSFFGLLNRMKKSDEPLF